MTLFQMGQFTLRSGRQSLWKIECDSLTESDWETLAHIASRILAPFSEVEGVPRGGLPFARALSRYCQSGAGLLIAEDVVTTGGAMETHRDGRPAIGVCVFARGRPPSWITPLFLTPDAN